ncbi:NAAT family transporter [Poseidonibacter lekithochrous]|uniref:MarC family protein n=1 Tax=Poseidonibacter TaxID=2321187 RepID=UPI001C09BA97|nr:MULTISPECIES: NAAT family transporter [Poseidonibacter]MBU3015134.1 NAAT family transporter [Poseidonibacter lekithochrous]MDO6828431.1 NAAT family transporter [Poseidonibacter sp. 1_MG-2023]
MLEIEDYIKIFFGVFAIMGPFSVMPIFVNLTAGKSKLEKQQLAKNASIAGLLVALCSVWLGSYILGFFNIGIPAFRVAGGILLLSLAINMINAKIPGAKQTPEELAEAKVSNRDLAIIPLAIPLIMGPGAISTVIVFSNNSSGIGHLVIMSIIVSILILNIFIFLRAAAYLSEKLGLIGINVISRIMGLILAAIAVEFMASGLIKLFPGWA